MLKGQSSMSQNCLLVSMQRWRKVFKINAIILYIIFNQNLKEKIEGMSSKRFKFASAPIEGSDQPAHPHSLIRLTGALWVANGLMFLQSEN